MTETGHAYIFSTAWLSKRWFDALPADLKTIVLATCKQAEQETVPWSMDFLGVQRKVGSTKAGNCISLSAADHAELMQKMAPIGPDIVKTKPDLKPLWDQLLAAVKRSQ